MEISCEKCAVGFIEDIWNSHKFEMLPIYLHPRFIDHSLPPGLQNASGLMLYLTELTKNLNHKTVIEKLIPEQNFVVIKVQIKLSTTQNPCDTQFIGIDDETITGHRILAFVDQRIIGHWEFLEALSLTKS